MQSKEDIRQSALTCQSTGNVRMRIRFTILEERLEREKEIDTPIDLMTWAYYGYVKERVLQKWYVSMMCL